MRMVQRTITITMVCTGTVWLGCLAAFGITADPAANPYKVINVRNIFGLQDPPPVVEPPPIQEEVASNIKLTGITKILGQTRVLMLVQEMGPGNKPLPDSKEESYMLQVGQAQGPIEVLEIIDEKEGKVRIKNAGKPMVISFETHGTKLAAAPPAAPPVGAAANKVARTTLARPPAANRLLRGIAPGTPVATPSGIQEFPTRPVRSNEDSESAAISQYIMIEGNRELTSPDVAAGLAPPLPGTPMTELLEEENGGGALVP